MKANKKLEFAQIKFDNQSQNLTSLQFDDIYYSTKNSFLESQFNFIAANNLSARFNNLFTSNHSNSLAENNNNFTIAETGFGTGLNFLLTAQLWQKTRSQYNDNAAKKSKLFYISTEKHPINIAELRQIHANPDWQQFAHFTNYLQENYPPNNAGFYLISFDDYAIDLLLLYGDTSENLAELVANVDAWFLDGFAPTKNPQMWNDDLFIQIKRLSHPQTTLSSFTAASNVRKKLESINANVTKHKGFGKKREMITADFAITNSPNDNTLSNNSDAKPTAINQANQHEYQEQHQLLKPTWAIYPENKSPIGVIAVIGAGIAGATLANNLAKHGQKVLLIEKDSYPQGASTVTAASTHLHPSYADNIKRDFDMSAYFYAISQLNTHFCNAEFAEESCWQQTGLVDLESDKRYEALLQNIQIDNFFKAETYQGKTAIHYLKSGALRPKILIDSLIKHDNITTLFDTPITDLQLINSENSAANINNAIWKLTTSNQKNQLLLDNYQISHVVLCTGYLTHQLYPPIKSLAKFMRGQLTKFATDLAMDDRVICQQNMLIKQGDKHFYAGGTYDLQTISLTPTEKDDQINYNNLIQADKRYKNVVITDEKFVGVRLASNDTLPLVGMTPDIADFTTRYDYLTKNARKQTTQTAKYHPNLYINTALGSKGMIYAFLNAKIINAMIFNTPIPVPFSELVAVNPARFIIRKLKRNEEMSETLSEDIKPIVTN